MLSLLKKDPKKIREGETYFISINDPKLKTLERGLFTQLRRVWKLSNGFFKVSKLEGDDATVYPPKNPESLLTIPAFLLTKPNFQTAFAESESTASLSPELIKTVFEWIKGQIKSGHPPSGEELNKFIKSKCPMDATGFARLSVDLFKQGKLSWEAFGLLQDKYPPSNDVKHGVDFLQWSWLKPALKGIKPEIEQKLPRALQQAQAGFRSQVEARYVIKIN